MKQERVILSFIMVLIGLLVAGVTFYFYKSGEKTNSNIQTIISPSPTPTATDNLLLTIKSPVNEAVVENKTIKILGTTSPKATVIIITKLDQQVLTPDSTGDFNATVSLGNDQNLITIIAVLPNGETKQIQHTLTYTTNNF